MRCSGVAFGVLLTVSSLQSLSQAGPIRSHSEVVPPETAAPGHRSLPGPAGAPAFGPVDAGLGPFLVRLASEVPAARREPARGPWRVDPPPPLPGPEVGPAPAGQGGPLGRPTGDRPLARVPEPSGVVLAVSGLGALAFAARRRLTRRAEPARLGL
jgi:hypothetical protein